MIQLRDVVRSVVPVWLSDRHPNGPSAGFRILYGIAAVLDAAIEFLTQGIQARMPGVGTPTALPLIGGDRVITRGPGDTDAEYAAKCRAWLDKHRRRGSMEAIAQQIQEYLAGHPRVRVINRLGVWHTREEDGSTTTEYHPMVWDWDSWSHPERSANISELWIVVYPTHYPSAGNWGDPDGDVFGDNGQAFGLDAPLSETRTLRTLIDEWKSAGSLVRCVIFTFDNDDFHPTNIASVRPDGHWGRYSKIVADTYVPSRPSDMRFMDHETSPT